MEEKRGIKRVRSPSKEGSPSPSGAKTPPLAPSGSPPQLKSPPEVSSCCPRSPVFEQVGSSGKAPVVDLFRLLMKNVSLLIPRMMKSSLECFLETSTTTSYGCSVTARSSSSVTPMKKKKKRRCARRRPLTSKLRYLLLKVLGPTACTADADDADKGDTPDRVICGSSSGGDEADLP
jgi:hypothetical protein